MKYLFKYENFKHTNKYGENITEKEFYELYNKNCKNHKKNDFKIYRSITSTKPYIYVNPTEPRVSIEPENLHVAILSESERWKDFPPYNKSIIGAVNLGTWVSYYGNAYEIIPYDNNRIVVCPDSTIWHSFGGFGDYTGYIRVISKFLQIITDWDYKYKDDWKTIQNKINKINLNEVNDFESFDIDDNKILFKVFNNINDWSADFNYDYMDFMMLQEYINNTTNEKIIEYIDWLFDPKNNDFKLIKYDKNFSKHMNNFTANDEDLQIYCEGPVLLKKVDSIYDQFD